MQSQITCIAEHSVDLSLITKESKVLDLGCHNFGWAKAMLQYVNGMMCVDADPNIADPDDERINFIRGVIVGNDEKRMAIPFIKFGNGTGNYVDDGRPWPTDAEIEALLPLTLDEIFEGAGKPDLIKFDIEGSEVAVIMSLKEPPAKQLTIEWHMHTGTTMKQIKECWAKLEEVGYDLVFQDYSKKHGLAENFWDTLFVLRENFRIEERIPLPIYKQELGRRPQDD